MQSNWPGLPNWVFAKVVESSALSEPEQTPWSSETSFSPGSGVGSQPGHLPLPGPSTTSTSGQVSKPFSHLNFTPSAGKAAIGGGLTAVLQAAGGLLRFLGRRGDSGKFEKRRVKKGGEVPVKHDITLRRGPDALKFGGVIGSHGGHHKIVGRERAKPARAASELLNRVTSLLLENLGKIRNINALPTVLAAMLPPLTNAPSNFLAISAASDVERENSCIIGSFDETVRQHAKPSRRLPADAVIVEPRTGLSFPVLLEAAAGDQESSEQVLAGVGARAKSLIKLKSIMIYAFGLYVQPDQLRAKIGGKYAGVPPEELKYRSDFYDDLLTHGVDMTVRLVVHYKRLNMGMVRTAFETSLKSRLKKIKGAEEDKGLQDFCSLMSEDLAIFRGTTIDFRWQPGGALQTEIGGRRVGTIVSNNLCRAFFAMYIGDPPVSEPAKLAIGETFARLLAPSSTP